MRTTIITAAVIIYLGLNPPRGWLMLVLVIVSMLAAGFGDVREQLQQAIRDREKSDREVIDSDAKRTRKD